MEGKRYEIYQTNPIKVIYEGSLSSAVYFYNTKQKEYFEQNHTLGMRVTNSYHWQWVDEYMYKFYGFIGVNPATKEEYFSRTLIIPITICIK